MAGRRESARRVTRKTRLCHRDCDCHGMATPGPAAVEREKRDSVAPELLLDDAAMLAVLQRRPTCPKAVDLSEGRRPVRRPSTCPKADLSEGRRPVRRPTCPKAVDLSEGRPVRRSTCPKAVDVSEGRPVRRSTCPKADLSEGRRPVRRPSTCPKAVDLSEGRPVRRPSTCPKADDLSEGRRPVRRPSTCPKAVDLSEGRRPVRRSSTCPKADLSEGRRPVRRPSCRLPVQKPSSCLWRPSCRLPARRLLCLFLRVRRPSCLLRGSWSFSSLLNSFEVVRSVSEVSSAHMRSPWGFIYERDWRAVASQSRRY